MELERRSRVPVAARGLAGIIVVVTLAATLRIITLVPGGEAELTAWLAAAVLLVGLAAATVVLTCAGLLASLEVRTAADEGAGSPDVESGSPAEPPDYVT
jgi:hypothetical protein